MKLTLPAPIQKIVGILNFTVGADVLPKSPLLAAFCLMAFAGAVFLFQENFFSPARAAASAAGSAVLLSAVAVGWARFAGYGDRALQTLTAMALGGGIVIFIRTALGFFIYVAPIFAELPDTNVRELEAFLLFPLYVWNIVVFAFLFRRSFRASVVVVFAVAIIVVIMVYFTVPLAFKFL